MKVLNGIKYRTISYEENRKNAKKFILKPIVLLAQLITLYVFVFV
jgi:hypothetical protein